MCENKPITDEELWGEPPEDLLEPGPSRNYFDEQAEINQNLKHKKTHKGQENDD